jgi:SAM-dependent methyltransferase
VKRERLGREYFERLYTESPDPWDFESSAYEKRKYERTLEALGSRTFGRALEAGCSIGVFTTLLAPRCTELLAVDASQRAVEIARSRLADQGQVHIERRTLPEEMPDGPFDLVVASEILYYWPREVVLEALRGFEEALAPGGVLVAVHWRKETRTYPLQGDDVHELLLAHTHLMNVRTVREPEYRLDIFEDHS